MPEARWIDLVVVAGCALLACGGSGLGVPATCNSAAECAGTMNAPAQCVAGHCVLRCREGRADCDAKPGNGCEVDLSTDSRNCSACGRDCFGAACGAARCDPAVVAVGQRRPRMIVVDATSAYWTTEGEGRPSPTGSIVQCPLDAPTPQVLADGRKGPFGIAIDGSFVYWGEGDEGSYDGVIGKVPIGGGPVTELARGQGQPVGIAVDATHVYWANFHGYDSAGGNGGVMKVEKSGAALTVLADGTDGRGYGLAVDRKNVYWVDEYLALVRAVPLDGGTATVLASLKDEGRYPRYLVIDATDAYFTMLSDRSIHRVPLAGGPTTVVSQGEGSLHTLALADDSVFFVDGDAIKQAPKAGGPATVLARDSEPLGIAVDARAVYWTSYKEGRVMRIAR